MLALGYFGNWKQLWLMDDVFKALELEFKLSKETRPHKSTVTMSEQSS